jgi:hypothetical protein
MDYNIVTMQLFPSVNNLKRQKHPSLFYIFHQRRRKKIITLTKWINVVTHLLHSVAVGGVKQGILKGGSIIVPLTSCLTCLD